MVIVELGEDLFHNGLAEEGGFGVYTKFVAVLGDGSHLAVIQVDDLSVFADEGLFLFLYIFRVDSPTGYFLLPCHFDLLNFTAKLVIFQYFYYLCL